MFGEILNFSGNIFFADDFQNSIFHQKLEFSSFDQTFDQTFAQTFPQTFDQTFDQTF